MIKYTVCGEGLKAKDLKAFLHKSYDNKLQDHGHYKVDKSLSGQRVQVYHNPINNHTVIAHRGTKGIHDVLTDAKLMFGMKNNNRFNYSKKIQKQAEEKYKDSNITTLGHSLGSKLAEEATNKDGEIITLNKAHHPFDNTKHKNQVDLRTKLDPVSIFNNKNNITIKSKTINPFTEHSTNTLDRLPQDQYIGSGINKYIIKDRSYEIARKLGVEIKVSSNPKKKIDVYKDGKKIASVGAIGYEDYPSYLLKNKELAEKKRKQYIARHKKDIDKIDSNGYFAYHLLWT